MVRSPLLDNDKKGNDAPPLTSLERAVCDEWRLTGISGFLSKLTFSWLFPLLRLGYSRQLRLDDIGGECHVDEEKNDLVCQEDRLCILTHHK
jgi:hypothetical protein